MNDHAGLTVEKVSRSFGGVQAVRDVSLKAPLGRITGLIGPNGAGKTSLINLISGLLAVDSGRVVCGGLDITRLPPHRVSKAGVARTFQNVRLWPEMSALDNVRIAYEQARDAHHTKCKMLRRRRESRDIAMELLNALQVRGAHELAVNLPYGLQRRVEIARALAPSPRIALLDEPVAGMNDPEANALAEVLAEVVSSRQVGILLVEHNMRFLMRLSSEVYVLDQGAVIASGAPEVVRRSPKVRSAYLGS